MGLKTMHKNWLVFIFRHHETIAGERSGREDMGGWEASQAEEGRNDRVEG